MANFSTLTLSIRMALGLAMALGPAELLRAQPASGGHLGVLSQAAGLPADFNEHFFDVPLAVRVDLDGRFLGEAMVVLTRDERVQLLQFTDASESLETPQTRQQWAVQLAAPTPLGPCPSACNGGLLALHYSLANSQLSILTQAAERDADAERFYSVPEQGSTGVILRNQLNLVGTDYDTTGRYALQGQGSIGQWTALAEAQVDRSSESLAQTRHRVDQLYGERVQGDRFLRLGYFTPSVQGLTRQPRLLGDTPDTTLGLMYGTSDSLAINNGAASSTPIYVTPNRPGLVEIYRAGVLINSQPVQPGLQTLDTKVLPGGIYEVEVRLIEDGQVTSTSEEFIYKPQNWTNLDEPWRYNFYLGRQENLLSNWDDRYQGGLSAGLIGNYLVHPRAVLGLSTQRVAELMQYGTSLDWDIYDRFKLFGNLYHTDQRGNGYDLQGLWNYEGGNLVLSHSRAWQRYVRDYSYRGDSREERERFDRLYPKGQLTTTSSLSLHHRLNRKHAATVRLSHSQGANSGTAVDLGWSYYGRVFNSDSTWRLSVFDRPATASSGDARSRGVNLSLSMSVGGSDKRLSASLGSRSSRDGQRDVNGSLSYQQDVEYGALRTLGGTVTGDRYGTGVGANAQFQSAAAFGDAYLQTSSYNNELSGGLNLESTVALGAGHMAFSGEYQTYDAGMIVDVESDISNLELRADDYSGFGSILRPGRNIVPVGAYKAGNLVFDFQGSEAHAAVIQPPSLGYHLNRGGVGYQQVRVMRTVTVLGRLLDAQGAPIRGAMVINHASRSVSEADGFFAVEMSESTPTLEVRHNGSPVCFLRLDDKHAKRENEVLLVGDQACTADSLADGAQTLGNREA
jgi:hypothetical protein